MVLDQDYNLITTLAFTFLHLEKFPLALIHLLMVEKKFLQISFLLPLLFVQSIFLQVIIQLLGFLLQISHQLTLIFIWSKISSFFYNIFLLILLILYIHLHHYYYHHHHFISFLFLVINLNIDRHLFNLTNLTNLINLHLLVSTDLKFHQFLYSG